LKSLNIPVVLIEPSFISTPLVDSIPARLEYYLSQTPSDILDAYGGAEDFRQKALKHKEIIEKTVIPVEQAMPVIFKAYCSLSPHFRYPIGQMAVGVYYLSFLPTEITSLFVPK